MSSFIELEDSFIDSLLNFNEDHPNSSLLLEPMDSSDVIPNFKKLNSVNIDEDEPKVNNVCLTSGAEVVSCLDDSKVESGDEKNITHDMKREESVINLEGLKDEVKSLIETVVKKNDMEEGEKDNGDGSEEDEEEEGSDEDSSSSSSSSSDDEEEGSDDDDESGLEKVKEEVEMEEGEMRDEVAAWSDDGDEDVVKGPIRSYNEVKDLPPVPEVTVTIQPHHQTLPIGVVLSIMGTQVIVEGVESHNPLNEGSILWITESRSPLGVIDEIFGPVKNPYYIIRYNSETEIPAGIQQGSSISFVPEFADFVLTSNNNLYKKGYDASGENDEEVSEELEFSDDEKEAEYKKMMKMSKRGSNEQNMKKDKKSRNKGGKFKNNHQSVANTPVNASSSSGPTSGQQAPNFTPGGVWPNGFPSIQPQNNGFPSIQPQNNGFPSMQPQNNGFPSMQPQNNGFPCNVSPFMQPGFMQQPGQNLGMPNLPMFNPQFNNGIGQMFPCNFGPPNMGAFGFWPQNNMNQSQAWPSMGLQQPPMGLQQPGVASMPNGLEMKDNNNNNSNNGAARPSFNAAGNSNGGSFPSSNQGNGFPNRGGRKPFQRGGGRFRGGRSKS